MLELVVRVVKNAIANAKGKDFGELGEIIKKTAFKITRVGQLVAFVASENWGFLLESSIYH